jgi:hypothetical protein
MSFADSRLETRNIIDRIVKTESDRECNIAIMI